VADLQQELPNKLYFKIGEVASIVGVKPYVLRYWETEFSSIRPTKTSTRHRMYRRKDVQVLLQIKRLLYDERFTIEGARRHLKSVNKKSTDQKKTKAETPTDPSNGDYRRVLLQLRKELESLSRLLS
jgi:DNA-binding transcriptional MerR regulator